MVDLRAGRYTLGAWAAVVMLTGCGGNTSGGVLPMNATPNTFPYHKSFFYTGAAQEFKVPAGVRQLSVVALGAHGSNEYGKPVALGGRVHATIPVAPGETLVVYVGGDAFGTTGGFNGGAGTGEGPALVKGFGGGGASDVRQGGDGLANRVLVVGGGGGHGGDERRGGAGGKGGGATGGSGGAGRGICPGGRGGLGGTQTAGGSGGTGAQGTSYRCFGYGGESGVNGTVGSGGAGGERSYALGGGGGGGGYYGGGGGGSGLLDDSTSGSSSAISSGGGGGGGGSSYAERKATDVHMWQGWKQSAHNGLVVISWD
jgi:hypothetical protein